MKTSEYADLMYLGPRARQSHWVPWGLDRALCGQLGAAAGHTSWYGTGDMDEWDRAEALPLCAGCADKAAS